MIGVSQFVSIIRFTFVNNFEYRLSVRRTTGSSLAIVKNVVLLWREGTNDYDNNDLDDKDLSVIIIA